MIQTPVIPSHILCNRVLHCKSPIFSNKFMWYRPLSYLTNSATEYYTAKVLYPVTSACDTDPSHTQSQTLQHCKSLTPSHKFMWHRPLSYPVTNSATEYYTAKVLHPVTSSRDTTPLTPSPMLCNMSMLPSMCFNLCFKSNNHQKQNTQKHY